MPDLIDKALKATRESKHIEFKQGFEPNVQANWCEVVKDVVAVANSGGGIILFGLDSSGQPSGESVEAIERVDPADLANKIAKYTGPVDLEFEIRQMKKRDHPLVALVIQGVVSPLIFQKPGTYEVEPGKQRTAPLVSGPYTSGMEPRASPEIPKTCEKCSTGKLRECARSG